MFWAGISEQKYLELLSIKTEAEKFEVETKKLQSEIEWLKHQLAELQRMIFDAKSERFIAPDPTQLILFDFPATATPEKQTEELTYIRTRPETQEKKQLLRAELPAHLPRKVEVTEPENLPEGAKKIGEASIEVLEYEPASMYVRQIVRPKYIVESTDESTLIEIAQLPSLPILVENSIRPVALGRKNYCSPARTMGQKGRQLFTHCWLPAN